MIWMLISSRFIHDSILIWCFKYEFQVPMLFLHSRWHVHAWTRLFMKDSYGDDYELLLWWWFQCNYDNDIKCDDIISMTCGFKPHGCVYTTMYMLWMSYSYAWKYEVKYDLAFEPTHAWLWFEMIYDPISSMYIYIDSRGMILAPNEIGGGGPSPRVLI